MSASLRLVFAGTPAFAVPCLKACLASHAEPVVVYTRPDRRTGRGRKPSVGPVKQTALDALLPVEQPVTLTCAEAQNRLAVYAPDLLVVVAYGLILPRQVLEIPRFGCWNLHASLLPRWRGAAPIQHAILAGDTQTGITLMQMEAGLDTGPVLLEKRIPILHDDTGGTLHDRLAVLAAALLKEGLARIRAGEMPTAVPQSDEGVTWAHKLDKTGSTLDFRHPASVLERQVRAFNPWPGSDATIAGKVLRIWAAKALEQHHDASPGTVLGACTQGIDLACGQGVLRITTLQRVSGRRMSAGDYLNGHPKLRHAGSFC